MAEPEVSPEQVEATIQSRGFVVLLFVAAIVGVVVSLAAWCFLELVNQIQRGVYVHLPSDVGYHGGPPIWWSLPVLALAGLIIAFAIERLPGEGGHIPANGLSTAGGPALPVDLPGVILAALATIGLGIVLGPEAPLIALGSGLGVLTIGLARRDAPPQVVTVIAAAGTFAAVSFLFQSPLLAAVLMIEVIGLGGPKLTLVLLPGLLAAGHRFARLARHGLVDRAEHERLRAGFGGRARQVRPARHRRLRLDDRARARRRGWVRAHRSRWQAHRGRRRREALRAAAGGRADRRRACDRISAGHRQALPGSSLLRPELDSGAASPKRARGRSAHSRC